MTLPRMLLSVVPPTHQMAVNPIIIFTLTFKARNLNNRVLRHKLLLECPVCSHQKRGLMLELLVSTQPQSHYPMHMVDRSTAQLERAASDSWRSAP